MGLHPSSYCIAKMMINDNEELLQLSEVLVNLPTASCYKSREVFKTAVKPHEAHHAVNFAAVDLDFGTKFSSTGARNL